MSKPQRVFATCDIGESINLLRERGYEVEVYPKPEPPPKSLIVEKLKSGIDGLITTLRDQVDAELFEAGKGRLKVVAQYAVGFDNINRADANRYHIPFLFHDGSAGAQIVERRTSHARKQMGILASLFAVPGR
jgi:glyoxylate reductase